MAELNYHHLRIFWSIAHANSLTRAAKELHLSQSALSVQLRKLEDQLGHPLFDRRGRQLHLTEEGRMTLAFADTIFQAGDELIGALSGKPRGTRAALRVGALTTLSRNLQIEFLRPLVGREDVELIVRSGTMRELVAQLEAQTIDVALTNSPVRRDARTPLHSHLLDEQPVSLVGRPLRTKKRFRFPQDLATTPVLVPSLESGIRVSFDRALALAGIHPQISAEVDDMAMLRLLARESHGVTLVPPIVVKDELARGELVERCRVPEVTESFYAIVANRRFPSPLLKELLARPLSRRVRQGT